MAHSGWGMLPTLEIKDSLVCRIVFWKPLLCIIGFGNILIHYSFHNVRALQDSQTLMLLAWNWQFAHSGHSSTDSWLRSFFVSERSSYMVISMCLSLDTRKHIKVTCSIRELYILSSFYLFYVHWDLVWNFFPCRGTVQRSVTIFNFYHSWISYEFLDVLLECSWIDFNRSRFRMEQLLP